MKKKIGLHIGTEPYSGGMFQYNQAMLEALSSLKQYDIVVTYTTEIWSEYLSQYNFKSVYVKPEVGFLSRVIWKLWRELKIPLSWWGQISSIIHSVIRQMIREECDLWIFPSQDDLSYQIKTPVLAMIHDVMHRYETFPEISSPGEYKWREFLFSNMCKAATGLVVDSQVGKEHVIESYQVHPEKIYVLPFIPPKYVISTQETPEIDKRYHLPNKFIFYPAQFWEHKNHKNLIKAIDLLVEKLPDIQLVLVGSTKNGYEAARSLVTELNLENHVHFLGYVPDNDVVGIYRRARAMIMPTFLGPTNIPPLEGFALGCPVAVSNIYGMPEQVGDAALLFDPQSEQEIAAIIGSLWTDDELCDELIAKGLARHKTWGQEQFNARLSGIIEAVVDSQAGKIYK